MKFNLETIKKAFLNFQEKQDAIAFSKLKGELKGFEAELTEKCTEKACEGCVDRDSCIVCGKEILGE